MERAVLTKAEGACGIMSETVVCVGAVVRRAEEVLLVRQSQGHSLEGKWTVPWGQIDRGESPTVAVLREIREEAGVTAQVEGLLGLQELPEPWVGMIGILFLCTHLEGEPVPDMQETDAARYFDLNGLEAIAGSLEPLSSWLVRRFLKGSLQPLKDNEAGPFPLSRTYL